MIEQQVKRTLTELYHLGMDFRSLEAELIKNLHRLPEDMLADFEEAHLISMIFQYLGNEPFLSASGIPTSDRNRLYTLNTEMSDIEKMYTPFLKDMEQLMNQEMTFTDIVEDISNVDMEAGTGNRRLTFTCNGKKYNYDVKTNHDWFDTAVFEYIGKLVRESETGKSLYITTDAWGTCILFYETEEWSGQFNKGFGEDFKLTRL